jgi:hydroxymethylbilane synthase
LQAESIRIGTRGSLLALAQANEVKARLMAAHGFDESTIEIRVIKTTGDRIQDRPLSEAGGKGLFTKEIEEALISREVDLAVHSMKDMQTELPDALVIGAVLPREDVRDAFLSLKYASLAEMPRGAIVGTSSLRRQAQVKQLRPDLQVVGFRGNVQTRLRKLEEGVADATFLACAGLKRLGIADRVTAAVSSEQMLPAVAQAAIGIEIRRNDERVEKLIAPLNHEQTAICVTAERAYLAKLEGSCRTPIAGLAELDGATLKFRGQILTPDGRQSYTTEQSGPARDAAAIGVRAADELLSRAGRDFFTAVV